MILNHYAAQVYHHENLYECVYTFIEIFTRVSDIDP